VRGIFIKKSNW